MADLFGSTDAGLSLGTGGAGPSVFLDLHQLEQLVNLLHLELRR